MGRSDLFKAASEKRQQEIAEQQNRGGGYVEVPYGGLVAGQDRVFRPLGAPLQMRQEPTDPRKIAYSLIRGDDEKLFLCVMPPKDEDRNYLLYRIINLVLDYTWDNETQSKKYKYASQYPALFAAIAKNNNTENPMETGWRPRNVVVMNAIDRQQYDWHREQRKTVVLSSRMKKKDDGRIQYDIGIPLTCYNSMWDDVAEYFGDWEDYDVVLRKMNDDPWYKALHATKEIEKIQDAARPFIVDGPMTDEEKSWERLDLDQAFTYTTFRRIQAKIGQRIAEVDQKFGSKFSEELAEKVAEEEKATAEQQKNAAPQPGATTPGASVAPSQPSAPQQQPSPDDQTVQQQQQATPQPHFQQPPQQTAPAAAAQPQPQPQQPAAATPSAPPRRSAVPQQQQLFADTLDTNRYPGIQYLTTEMKELIVGVNDDGSLRYAETDRHGEPVTLWSSQGPNGETYISPGQFTHCPYTGFKFPDDEGVQ